MLTGVVGYINGYTGKSQFSPFPIGRITDRRVHPGASITNLQLIAVVHANGGEIR